MPTDSQSLAPLELLRRFESDHGRPLRVLHIGNIANNAYINAKIQRRIGIEADVCCYDYFHVMGCPEWEDADFDGEVSDQFFPDWWAVDLHGFQRPAWFAQGRLRTCQRYLLALRRGDERLQRLVSRQLRMELWLRCRSTRTARFLAALAGIPRETVPAKPVLGPRTSKTGIVAPLEWLTLVGVWLLRMVRYFVTWFVWRLRVTVMRRIRTAIALCTSVIRTGGRKTVAGTRAVAAVAAGRGWRTAALMVFPRKLDHLARTDEHRAMVDAAWRVSGSTRSSGQDPFVDLYRELFGEIGAFSSADYAPYLGSLAGWRLLLEQYDVIQAYALDPVIPLLSGTRNYVAYEHGTLRDLPFEESPRGRLCALSYRAAPVAFLTNSDVIPSARRLGLSSGQMVFLPHAVDSERLSDFAAENAVLRPSRESRVTFVSPTRHDWADGDPLWAKGNDRLIHALGRVIGEGLDCRLVLFDWGRHVDESKGLIDELGLSDYVVWSPTLRKRALWREYMQAHAVVDQFLTPALGSVAFEALALGRRVITALDPSTIAEFFGEMPPILNAGEPDGIAAAMRRIIDDPLDEAGMGRAAASWFQRRHSTDRILELELAAYRQLIER